MFKRGFQLGLLGLAAALVIGSVTIDTAAARTKVDRHAQCSGASARNIRVAQRECPPGSGSYCPAGTHCYCDSQGCFCVYDRPWAGTGAWTVATTAPRRHGNRH